MPEPVKKKQPTGGGRKGGATFPKIDLKKAVAYNKKLVSKTHTSPQPEKVILPGVFDSNTSLGEVRASALRQFGLLNEDKIKMEATDLGKSISSSPDEEMKPFLQTSCLKPKIFKQLFETFKGDKVTLAKLKQQATKVNVHPDTAENCVEIFIKSLEYAGLGQIDGDSIKIGDLTPENNVDDKQSSDNEEAIDDESEFDTNAEEGDDNKKEKIKVSPKRTGGSGVQVNISLDSTMDTDKLEKLLKLLKSYGAI